MSNPPSTCVLAPDESPVAVPRPVHDERSYAVPILPLRRNDFIGRFRIERRLGHGGMGIVYAARDHELGRRVALKLVRHRAGELPDPRFTARLRREAQALARLSHPNVVGLYDMGTTSRGIFLAMEYIPGPSLSEWLGKEPRSWREIVRVFVEAGRGLVAAHAAGIIHRDFKPGNVIVGEAGRVAVVDFGLARASEDMRASSDSSALLLERLTRTNVILGTKGYMAPEQLLGLPVGPRCDQFSFCVTLFEALYGMHPYPGENALETARSFADGQLVRPLHRRGVPGRIHRALERGLSIEPDARFRDMAALVDALAIDGTARKRRWGMVAAIVATAWASVGATLLVHREDPQPEPVCDAGTTVDAAWDETTAPE